MRVEAVDRAAGQDGPAVGRRQDGPGQLVAGGVLAEVAAGAGAQGPSTSSSWSNAVRATIAASGSSARMPRIASTPSPSGMRRSISTTSGRRERHTTSASRPEAASPTTSTEGSASAIRRLSPRRVNSWSLTITSRTVAATSAGTAASPRGRCARTLVPQPGVDSISSVPPISRARSAMPRRPIPLSTPACSTSARSKPRPSSWTSSDIPSPE